MHLALRKLKYFSSTLKVPIIDLKDFLRKSGSYVNDCKNVSQALHKYGVLIVKDPRVNPQQNNEFLDMMEGYFSKRGQAFQKGDKKSDFYPQYHYQVGATPQFTQKAKDHLETTSKFTAENKATSPSPPVFDAKWRYFWNVANSLEDKQPNQSPNWIPQFGKIMDGWGNRMIDTCFTVAQMTAIGLGLQQKIFTKMMQNGPHKLAPTGSDLTKYQVGTIFAGFHYDFNFLTIHGRSRYPGLFAWLRTGQKFSVNVPQGHLLLQSGKQFDYLTGGYITCGYHQVIYTQQAKKAKQKAVSQGRIPWRVSSTLFSHIHYDKTLEPIGKFRTPQNLKKYPPVLAYDFSMKQLQDISLKL